MWCACCWRPTPTAPTAPTAVRKYVRYGASPRGAQAIVLAAKIRALLEGPLRTSPSRMCARCAMPALRHRLILNFEGEAEGVSTDEVIEEVRGEDGRTLTIADCGLGHEVSLGCSLCFSSLRNPQ